MNKTVVIDTSVIISALIGKKGPSREVIRRCLNGKLSPIISNALFSEYQDVTKRQNIVELCPLSNEETQELLNAFYGVARWVSIYYLWRPNLIDEGDNFVIELAIAGNATEIITNNIRDFNNSEISFPELKIVTPEILLKGK
ncbi:MAG: putative toxin-antitoxin system toxin component, PIN family [Proteobacteria bacterium]|nr:putative toxin-antitoxin system toxin component, PIN family [Pseudomonadota bacterium]